MPMIVMFNIIIAIDSGLGSKRLRPAERQHHRRGAAAPLVVIARLRVIRSLASGRVFAAAVGLDGLISL
jgi:hypothetical protein